jgi:alpha-ketoglutarate-dependent taurine dioxygenase
MPPVSQMSGVFHDSATGELEQLRWRILDQPEWYAEPEWADRIECSAGELLVDDAPLRRPLAGSGLVEARLDRPLTSDELITLGRRLGSPLPENAVGVQEFVEQGVLLNVIAVHGTTEDIDLQPFSDTALTLHTERSGAAFPRQPRFLVFLCLRAPEPGSGGQTLLVRGADVYANLAPAHREVLRHTSYAAGQPPPILCGHATGPRFSFRDFRGQQLHWRYHGPEPVDESAVNGAIHALTAAMYQPECVRGVWWRPSTMVVLDNATAFHGRSAARPTTGANPRHLKRLRVLAAAGDD